MVVCQPLVSYKLDSRQPTFNCPLYFHLYYTKISLRLAIYSSLLVASPIRSQLLSQITYNKLLTLNEMLERSKSFQYQPCQNEADSIFVMIK